MQWSSRANIMSWDFRVWFVFPHRNSNRNWSNQFHCTDTAEKSWYFQKYREKAKRWGECLSNLPPPVTPKALSPTRLHIKILPGTLAHEPQDWFSPCFQYQPFNCALHSKVSSNMRSNQLVLFISCSSSRLLNCTFSLPLKYRTGHDVGFLLERLDIQFSGTLTAQVRVLLYNPHSL